MPRKLITAETSPPLVDIQGAALSVARGVKAPPAIINPWEAMAGYYVSELDGIDKKLRLRAGAELTVDPISTGNLCSDWVIGGGVRTAMNQVSGFEAAGKSTLCVSTLGGAVQAKVPLIIYSDPEGSLTPDYADAVLNSFGLSEVFDQVKRRYYSTNVLEDVTNQIARLIRRFPDKAWSEELNCWVYIIPKGLPKWTPVLNALKAAGMPSDKAASTETHWVIPTSYSGAECFWAVDSWATLNPSAVDDLIDKEKDSGAGLAIFARTMAEELPKFSGRLKRKAVILFGVNHLREAPMQIPPVKEFGGNALRNHSMVRSQMAVRAVPEGYDRDPDASNLCIEESVYGNGYDRYAFKSFNNTKNKLGRPFLKTMLRVWTSDEKGVARGFDPVFDTWNYLRTTEQVTGGRRKGFMLQLKPAVKGVATQLNGIKLTWHQFKTLVVAEHFRDAALLKSVAAELDLKKAPKLRVTLFEQIRTDKSLWGEQQASGSAENDD